DDHIQVKAQGGKLLIESTDSTKTFLDVTIDTAPTGQVIIQGAGGNDTFIFDSVPGSFTGKLKFDGGTGTNTVQSSAGGDYVLSNSQLTVGTEVIALASITQADLSSGGNDQSFSVGDWTGSGSLNGGNGS